MITEKELQLVTSENFYNSEANIYQDSNKDIYMTIEQITSCLGYQDERGVYKILERHPYLKRRNFQCSSLCRVLMVKHMKQG